MSLTVHSVSKNNVNYLEVPINQFGIKNGLWN